MKFIFIVLSFIFCFKSLAAESSDAVEAEKAFFELDDAMRVLAVNKTMYQAFLEPLLEMHEATLKLADTVGMKPEENTAPVEEKTRSSHNKFDVTRNSTEDLETSIETADQDIKATYANYQDQVDQLNSMRPALCEAAETFMTLLREEFDRNNAELNTLKNKKRPKTRLTNTPVNISGKDSRAIADLQERQTVIRKKLAIVRNRRNYKESNCQSSNEETLPTTAFGQPSID